MKQKHTPYTPFSNTFCLPPWLLSASPGLRAACGDKAHRVYPGEWRTERLRAQTPVLFVEGPPPPP